MNEPITFTTLAEHVGQELGVSDWVTIDQDMINQFADATNDHQWIHVDEARAQQSPLGSTIAHGYLTLSLLPSMRSNVVPEGVLQVFNYGCDRVRFITPVKAGSRIRNRAVLLDASPKGAGRLLIKTQNTVEIEGEAKPAMIADTLALLIAAT